MLKLFGSALILAACAGYAAGLLGQMKRRRDFLRSCLEMARLLMGEIRYERVPVAEALARVEKKLNRDLACVVRRVIDGLEKDPGTGVEELWESGCKEMKQKVGLTGEELEDVSGVGKNLGFLDARTQIGHLESCAKRLEQDLGKVQRELEEKGRLYRSLSLAAGIFLILILV